MTAIAARMEATTDPQHLPELSGDCRYCHAKLYEEAPFVQFPDGTMAHVACEVDARRQNRGG